MPPWWTKFTERNIVNAETSRTTLIITDIKNYHKIESQKKNKNNSCLTSLHFLPGYAFFGAVENEVGRALLIRETLSFETDVVDTTASHTLGISLPFSAVGF